MEQKSGESSAGQRPWRCFWAALLDSESERRLAAAVARLRARADQGLRWIPRVNWHLTLHFLGPTEPSRLGALGEALRIRPLVGSLSLPLRRIAPFPRNRPRTLAAMLATSSVLLDWVEYLRDCSPGPGPDPDRRAYRAHVTVARPRPKVRIAYPELELSSKLCFDRIALMRSETRPSGAVYSALAVQAAAAAAPGPSDR